MNPAPRAVAALSVLVLTGCVPSAPPEQAPQPTSTATTAATAAVSAFETRVQDLLTVDRTDPGRVAERFAALAVTWRPDTDRTQTAAVIRARPLMTPGLAGRTVEPRRNGSQALWNRLAPAHALSAASVAPAAAGEALPADTPDLVYRSYRVTWQWQTPTGARIGPGEGIRNFDIVLTRSGSRWSVAGYTTEDLPLPTER